MGLEKTTDEWESGRGNVGYKWAKKSQREVAISYEMESSGFSFGQPDGVVRADAVFVHTIKS